jgi:hypothetical protein
LDLTKRDYKRVIRYREVTFMKDVANKGL